MNTTETTKSSEEWRIERYRKIAERPFYFDPSLVGLEKAADKYHKANIDDDKFERSLEVPVEVYRVAIALFVERIANDVVEDLSWFIDRFQYAWEQSENEAHCYAEKIGYPLRKLTAADFEADEPEPVMDEPEPAMEVCVTCGQPLDYNLSYGWIQHNHSRGEV